MKSPWSALVSLAAVVPDHRLRMIDRHPLEKAVTDDIGTPLEAAPLLIGEALSQHEQAPDKVLPEWAHPYRNTLKPRLLAHDAVPPPITWTPEKGYGVVGLGCGLPP